MNGRQKEFITGYVGEMVKGFDAVIPRGTASREECLSAAVAAQRVLVDWVTEFSGVYAKTPAKNGSVELLSLVSVARDLAVRYVVEGTEQCKYILLANTTPRVADDEGLGAASAALVAAELIGDMTSRYSSKNAPGEVYRAKVVEKIRELLDRIRPVGTYLSVVDEDRKDMHADQKKYMTAILRRIATDMGVEYLIS